MKRRNFISTLGAAGVGMATARMSFTKPQITHGVQCGDIAEDKAIIWSRADRPARMIVEYSPTESFAKSRTIIGPSALKNTDYTTRLDLTELPSGQKIHYRVTFRDLSDSKLISEPVIGSFNTVPDNKRDVTFTWGGDVCGQGWGINPEFGGMKIFETMRTMQPDFFIHSGDSIYADNPIVAEVKLDDGTIWKNLTTPEKSKVAETLDEFRGNFKYNLLDENLKRFASQVPIFAQWDDHEVRNNWYPGQILDDPRYTVKAVDLLATRSRKAFLEYMPIRYNQWDSGRIFRAYNYGPLADIIMLDERSYRGANSTNNQDGMGVDTAFLGGTQMDWVKRRLESSKGLWKIIASDMPIGLMITDGPEKFEGVSNGNGPARGRELEIADLLTFIKNRKIKNVIWVTTDVHYAAAHYYDPNKAKFTDFNPFWEFIAGPLNAGTFGPSTLDDTFGPEVKFNAVPSNLRPNRSPKDGLQFFGAVKIEGKTGVMTVSIHNMAGQKLYSIELPPS